MDYYCYSKLSRTKTFQIDRVVLCENNEAAEKSRASIVSKDKVVCQKTMPHYIVKFTI